MKAMWRKAKSFLAVLLALGMLASGTDLTALAQGTKSTEASQEAEVAEGDNSEEADEAGISESSVLTDESAIPEKAETGMEVSGGGRH